MPTVLFYVHIVKSNHPFIHQYLSLSFFSGAFPPCAKCRSEVARFIIQREIDDDDDEDDGIVILLLNPHTTNFLTKDSAFVGRRRETTR